MVFSQEGFGRPMRQGQLVRMSFGNDLSYKDSNLIKGYAGNLIKALAEECLLLRSSRCMGERN
jgi:hypothetical protein